MLDSEYKIYLIDAVDWEMYRRFTKQMTHIETLPEELRPGHVVIELASDGGDALAALAIVARMRLSQLDIIVYAMGNAASAASLILACGDVRYMSKEAWVMVHEESGEITGNVVDMEVESKQKRRLENQWNKIMASRTSLTEKQWEKLNKQTTYLNAEQCLKAGIVDVIV